MPSKEEKDAVKEYLSGKLPFKDERDLAQRLQLHSRIALRLAMFERRFGLKGKCFVWLVVLSVSAVMGYWWAHSSLPEAAVASAFSHDLEFVRYRGNGLAIVYDHNLKETGRAQLNLPVFYSMRIATAALTGASLFFIFRRSCVSLPAGSVAPPAPSKSAGECT